MIYAKSVLKGYTASLGFFLVSAAFLIGTCTVKIPPEEELKVYSLENMDRLFGLQILVHILASVNSILRFYLPVWLYMELITEVSGAVTVILMIIVYMLQWQTLLLLIDPEIEDGLVLPYAKRSTEMQRF